MFNTEDDKMQFQSDLISLIIEANKDFDSDSISQYDEFIDACASSWELVEDVIEDEMQYAVTALEDMECNLESEIEVQDALFVDPELSEELDFHTPNIESIVVFFR